MSRAADVAAVEMRVAAMKVNALVSPTDTAASVRKATETSLDGLWTANERAEEATNMRGELKVAELWATLRFDQCLSLEHMEK